MGGMRTRSLFTGEQLSVELGREEYTYVKVESTSTELKGRKRKQGQARGLGVWLQIQGLNNSCNYLPYFHPRPLTPTQTKSNQCM